MDNIKSVDYIIINNENGQGERSDTVGLYVDTPPMPPMAEQVYTTYNTQTIGESTAYATDFYNDVTITVDCFVFDWGTDPSAIYAYINRAKTLQTSKNLDFYYKVKQIRGITPVHSISGKYKLSIQFICSPFRYNINNDPVECVNGEQIVNSGTVFSRPIWWLYGCNGDVDFTVNGAILKITGMSTQDVVIDTEKMIVHSNARIILDHTTGELPLLSVGYNTIEWSEGIDRVEVYKNERSV